MSQPLSATPFPTRGLRGGELHWERRSAISSRLYLAPSAVRAPDTAHQWSEATTL